jgi:hypothetical protein
MLADEEHDPRDTRFRGLAHNEIDFPAFWQALQERDANSPRAGRRDPGIPIRFAGDELHVAGCPSDTNDAHLVKCASGVHGVEAVPFPHAEHAGHVTEISA